MAGHDEELLHGGNTSVVVRVGDTVRRTPGPWNPAVHALLGHLHDAGFDGAPTPLGFDDEGREVLRYVEGEVGLLAPGRPLPGWFRGAEACLAVGRWLRAYHEAQRGFRPDPALPWRKEPGRALRPGEVVVHHDVAPYNTVRRPDGRLTVLDWDFAAPGDPLQDLAFTAWQWTPLWADVSARTTDHGGAATVTAAAERLRALADGYAATRDQRLRLLAVTCHEMRQHADTVETLARTDPAFARLVELGVARGARADAAWVSAHTGDLAALMVMGGADH